MRNCPYCGSAMENDSIHLDLMSEKRVAIFNFITESGKKGVKRDEVKAKFFKPGASDTSVRTTIAQMNKVLRPERLIRSRGGTIRLYLTADLRRPG